MDVSTISKLHSYKLLAWKLIDQKFKVYVTTMFYICTYCLFTLWDRFVCVKLIFVTYQEAQLNDANTTDLYRLKLGYFGKSYSPSIIS